MEQRCLSDALSGRSSGTCVEDVLHARGLPFAASKQSDSMGPCRQVVRKDFRHVLVVPKIRSSKSQGQTTVTWFLSVADLTWENAFLSCTANGEGGF